MFLLVTKDTYFFIFKYLIYQIITDKQFLIILIVKENLIECILIVDMHDLQIVKINNIFTYLHILFSCLVLISILTLNVIK